MNQFSITEKGFVIPTRLNNEEFSSKTKFSPPQVYSTVSEVVKDIPQFSYFPKGMLLYDYSHTNGFGTTRSFLELSPVKGRAYCADADVSLNFSRVADHKETIKERKIPEIQKALTETGFNNRLADAEEIKCGIRRLEMKPHYQLISGLRIDPGFTLAALETGIGSPVQGCMVYSEGPKRVCPSEKIRTDVLDAAKISQAMTDVFGKYFSGIEETLAEDDLEDLVV